MRKLLYRFRALFVPRPAPAAGRHLPLIDLLADCSSDRDRALWLLSVPYGVLFVGRKVIKEQLAASGFTAGLDYLSAVTAYLHEVRGEAGHGSEHIAKLLHLHASELRVIASRPLPSMQEAAQ